MMYINMISANDLMKTEQHSTLHFVQILWEHKTYFKYKYKNLFIFQIYLEIYTSLTVRFYKISI